MWSSRAAFVVAAACCLAAFPVAAAEPASDDVLSRATLTGDWGGLRPQLGNNGITFTFPYTTDLLTNVSGGIRRGSIYDGLFQPQMDVDLEKLVGWSGARFSAVAAVTHGPAFTPDYPGSFMTASNIETPRPIARLLELWYEQSTSNDLLSVRAGLLLRADTEFFTSQTAETFLNNTFGWTAWLATVLPAGGPAFSFSAPGARLRANLSEYSYFQAAVYSGDPSGGDGSNQGGEVPTGTVISFRGGTFMMAEFGYLPFQRKDDKPAPKNGLPGAYKLGAWYHTGRRFGDQRFDNTGLSLADPLSTGTPLDHRGNWGIYAVLDQMLYRVPGTDDRGLFGFFRIGSSPGDRNLIDFYADAGLVFQGPLPGRPKDRLGIGVAHARISDHARALDRDSAFFTGSYYPLRSGETLIELTYRAQLAPWWMLQGDVQYVIRPSGGVLNDDGSFRENAWVTVLRSVVNF